jgi:hypothetical protein
MALTLAQLQTKRDEIVQSLGLAGVTFGERSIQYARQQEALAAIDAEIAKQSPQSRQFVIQTSRGL